MNKIVQACISIGVLGLATGGLGLVFTHAIVQKDKNRVKNCVLLGAKEYEKQRGCILELSTKVYGYCDNVGWTLTPFDGNNLLFTCNDDVDGAHGGITVDYGYVFHFKVDMNDLSATEWFLEN